MNDFPQDVVAETVRSPSSSQSPWDGPPQPPGARRTAMEVAATADLRGRAAIVTGASSGLGLETARALASAGADVMLAVRNRDAGEAVAQAIRQEFNTEVAVGELELSDIASVQAFADAARAWRPALSILVENAGVSKTPQTHLANGLDVRFATNHLGHFLLAQLLLESMAAAGARIVVLSSAAHKNKPVRFDDLQWTTRPHHDLSAYGESKRANILFAWEATRRWGVRGVFANAVLPGSVFTGLQRYHDEALKKSIGFIDEAGAQNPAMKTIPQGAATSVWAAVAPELEGRGGLVLENCGLAQPVGPDVHRWSGYDPDVFDAAAAKELWSRSLAILADAGIHLDDNE